MFPAVRTPKLPVLAAYLLVTSGLIAVEEATDGREAKSAYACEDDQLVLECQAGEVIRIQRANYGRFTISLCNRHGETEGWSLQCMSTKAKDIISERCDGRRQCDMRVSNHVFGDPCPLTSKYAEVKYICHLAPVDITHNATTVATMAPNPPPMPLNGSPPQITSVTAHSPDTIEITWIQLRSPVPIRTTVLYLEETAVNEKPLVFYPNSSGSYIIENLKPNTVYSIYLKNFNLFGPSVTSNRVNVMTPPLALPPVTTLTTTLKPSSAAYISENTTHLLPPVAAVQNNPPNSGTFKGKLFSTLRKVFTSVFASSNDSSANTNHAADSTKSSTGTAKGSQLSVFIRVASSSKGDTKSLFNEDKNDPRYSEKEEKHVQSSHGGNTKLTDEKRKNKYYNGTEVPEAAIKTEKDQEKFINSPQNEGVQPGLDIFRRIVLAIPPTLEVDASRNVKMELRKQIQDEDPASAEDDKNSQKIQSETDDLPPGNDMEMAVPGPKLSAVLDSEADTAVLNKPSYTEESSVTHYMTSTTDSAHEASEEAEKLPKLEAQNRTLNMINGKHFGHVSHGHDHHERGYLLSESSPVLSSSNQAFDFFVRDTEPSQSSISSTIQNASSPNMDMHYLAQKSTSAYDSHLRPTTSRTGTVRPSFTDFWNKNSFDDTDSAVSTLLPSTTWPATLRPDLRLSTGHTSPKDPQPGYNESVSGVVDKFCDERVHMDVLWLKTRFGRRAMAACPRDLIGAATWRCLSYGWEEPGPDLSDCTSPWMESVDSHVEKVITGEEQPEEAATALTEAMRDQELTTGDVKRASMNLLPRLAQGFQQSNFFEPKPIRRQRIRKFTEKFVSASSILLSEKNSRSWQSLTVQEQRQAATTMLLAVEDTGFHAASLMDVGTSEVTVDENLVMEISVLDPVQVHNDITFPSKNDLSGTLWRADTDSITISSSSLKVVDMRGPINIVFTLYKNMEDLIQPMVNTIPTIPSSTYMGDNDNYYSTGTIRDSNMVEEPAVSTRRLVNSKIIAASINSTKQRRRLTDPVRFTLHHLEKSTSDTKMHCAFWDIDSSHPGGRWSQDGCQRLDTNATHTTCECDHLTNFAVLMDVTGVKLSQTNVLALRVITFVGCTISVVCLMLSWITFLVFKNLQCDRNTIHKNLVFCLLLAEIVFLAGIAQTEPKILCSIIACILHYLFLGSFAWMCLEGIQLYVMLVEVFEQEKSRVHWYYLFGYGVPALIVSISAGVYYQGYGTARHCWLTTERYFIWSFVGPVLAVMLINIGMLSIAVYIMCRHSNMSATMRDRSKGTKFSVTESLSSMETFAPPKLRFPELPAWVKGAIVLVVLLGLTWLLGVLYLNEESVIMAYAFTVLNSLQGLFIFIFHCLKNEKVQKEYRKVARRTSWLPNCIRVNYGGYTGVASSSPIGSSGSGNYLSKLFGQKRNRNSAISTNSSAKPFFSSDQHRGSDIVNSTSKESSNVPSSLNGYVYNPNYSTSGNGSVKTPLLSGGAAKLSQGGHTYMGNNYEMVDDLAVDLSEYVDCSVVDSGYVSEYCKHNMQVSREVRRYSTGSEDSDSGKPVIPHNSLEVDNLSTLSLASSSRKPSSYVSSTETCHRHADDDLDKNLEGKLRKETLDPGLNFRQYIIPVSRKMNTSSNNNNIHIKNINETSSADKISSSMNKLSKPIPSLSSIPESETSPQHSSAPNLQFRLNVAEKITESSTTNSPEGPSVTQDMSEPVYEEARMDLGSPSSAKSSLPNLSSDGPCHDSGDSAECIFIKQRHFSETDINFSPFKFPTSNC